MIPRGLLPGRPIVFNEIRPGDVIDTYSPTGNPNSRFHRRRGQIVVRHESEGSCDIYTDYDLICKHVGLWIQLIHRPADTEADLASERVTDE